MKRIGYTRLALMAICTVFTVGVAQASPAVNGSVFIPRFFNDCGVTTLSVINSYPALIQTDESVMLCTGGANMHLWALSSDGGGTQTVFNNTDGFHLAANVVLNQASGAVGTEGGLRVSPWWDQFANGYFQARLPDGEIAAFGGVLPGFNFTSVFGIHYTNNQPIRMEMYYEPNCNTAENPGTMRYVVTYGGQVYDSGPQAFGNCTPGEEIHGCYGIMDDARVGGRMQENFGVGGGDPNARNIDSFFDVFYEPFGQGCPVPTHSKTWGGVKATYR